MTLDIFRWFIVHVADAQQVLLQLLTLFSYTDEALRAQPGYDFIDSSIRWCAYMDLPSTSTDQHRYYSSNCVGLARTWRALDQEHIVIGHLGYILKYFALTLVELLFVGIVEMSHLLSHDFLVQTFDQVSFRLLLLFESFRDRWLWIDDDLAHAVELAHAQSLILAESCCQRLKDIDVHLCVA